MRLLLKAAICRPSGHRLRLVLLGVVVAEPEVVAFWGEDVFEATPMLLGIGFVKEDAEGAEG